MIKALIITGLMAAIVTAVAVAAITYPEAKLTFRIVDDESKAVAGADVGVGFQAASEKYFGNKESEVRGLSDKGGGFEALGNGDRSIGYTIQKPGYYQTIGQYDFKDAVGGKWQPWNPTIEVVVKKVGHPTAMYVRQNRVEIPTLNESIGFDLEIGELVAPHGRGTTADFVLTLNRKWMDKRDFDVQLALTFSNRGDGIHVVTAPLQYGSELKLPRTAPEMGYEPRFLTSISRQPGKPIRNEARDDRSFVYRVRTVLDQRGKVVSALYGKLRGDVRLDPINSKTAIVKFTSYLNPTANDRNLEFDPKQNLLPVVSDSERVKDP